MGTDALGKTKPYPVLVVFVLPNPTHPFVLTFIALKLFPKNVNVKGKAIFSQRPSSNVPKDNGVAATPLSASIFVPARPAELLAIAVTVYPTGVADAVKVVEFPRQILGVAALATTVNCALEINAYPEKVRIRRILFIIIGFRFFSMF